MKKNNPTKKTRSTSQRLRAPNYKESHLGEFVREVAGDEGLKIISCIGAEEVTDEKIEQGTRMKIAEIRSVLNHLHSYGLVEYRREKNMQTGWFTYTWKLNPNRALQNFITLKKKEYTALKVRLARGDGGQIYRCQRNCGPLEFEKAMETSFKCPVCNCRLNLIDQNEELKKLEEKINALTTLCIPVPTQLEKTHASIAGRLTTFNQQTSFEKR